MKIENRKSENWVELRQKAEEKLKLEKPEINRNIPEATMLKLIHELQVHQIELEMQNDELVVAKNRIEELTKGKYKDLYDFAPSGYLSITKDGDILELNFAAARMLGKERSKLMKNRFALFISQETRPVFNHFVQEVFTSKTKQSCEAIIVNEGNSVLAEQLMSIYVNIEGIVGQDNELCQLTVVDITDRKKAEQALKDSEMRFNVAIEGTEAGIWDWDLVNNTVIFSSQWKNMLGYSDDEIENSFEDWKKLWHPDDVERIEKSLNDHLAGLTEKYEIVHRLLHKNGKWRWIMTKGKLLKDENDKPYRWVGTNIDISSQKEAEEALKEANVNKDQFISILGHDLKSPFNTLSDFSNLLVKNIDKYDKEKIKTFAETINKTSKQTFNLLNNSLEWSRSQRDKIPFNPQTTNLYLLAYDTYMLLNYTAQAKQINIVLDIPEEMDAKVDSGMIKTVMRNLLSNAIKFTPEQGTIRISASKEQAFIQFVISHTGTGMSPETINSLFKIGKIVSRPGTNGERGTGFGLLLCKEFIHKHRGIIWVESEIGKGSTFKFTLPTLEAFADPSIGDLSDHRTRL